MRKKKKVELFDIANYAFFIILVFISLFPIYLILANAFSSESDITDFGYAVVPLNFNLAAFKYLFMAPAQLLNSLWASIVSAVGGALLNVVVSALMGYVLTRKEFIFRKLLTVMLTVTMFFGAGLIPSYILNTQVYHLNDKWLVYLLPGCVSAFSVFVYRSFFNQIPHSLIESAEIDGASHTKVFFNIVIPLSLPIMTTQFFLNMSGKWKDFTTSLYYISDPNMHTLEMYIQTLLKDASSLRQNLIAAGISADNIPVETMKFAVVFFTLVPMILVFPFFQKKLTKGATVGAVKG